MSAVPQKKLCWNCDGNISKEVNNCPYCGVYTHAEELEENSSWNPSYNPSSNTEEIPTPIYQIHPETDIEAVEEPEVPEVIPEYFYKQELIVQLKKDVFPILFLMMGSIFFLFGMVLFLFSQNGTLTLQWQGSNALYFLIASIPLVGCGWWYLQQLQSD